MTDPDRPKARRRITRGEGEVTQWPRGLVDYVSNGPEEGVASPEEDRTGNRLALAARLLGLLRARGEDVETELAELRAAERAYAANDRTRATELVERLLGDLEARDHPGDRGPADR